MRHLSCHVTGTGTSHQQNATSQALVFSLKTVISSRLGGLCTDPSSSVDQSQTYDGTHQGAPRRKVSVDRLGRRQVWASTGLSASHLKGVTRCSKSVLWPRWCHPPIPTGREDCGGGGMVRGHGTGVEASGPGTSQQ